MAVEEIAERVLELGQLLGQLANVVVVARPSCEENSSRVVGGRGYNPAMMCARHGLATGPDGQCALCHRLERAVERATAHGRDPARTIAIGVVAIMAAIATFFLVGALLDTR